MAKNQTTKVVSAPSQAPAAAVAGQNFQNAASNPNSNQKLPKGVFWRLVGLAKPYQGLFITAIVTSIVLSLVAAGRPWLMQYTIDTYIGDKDESGLLTMTVLSFGALIVEVGIRYGFMYSSSWLGSSIIRDLRTKTFAHVLRSRLGFYDRTPIGTLTTRTISDIETIADTFSEGLLTILSDVLQLVAVLSIMCFLNWKLTLVSLAVLPVLLWFSYWFKEAVRKSFSETRTQVSRLNAFVQEHITGMAIVQIFNRQDEEYKRFVAINSELNDANLRGIFAYSVFFPVVEIVTAASLGLLVWYGSGQALAGTASVGVIVAFTQYINQLYRPIRMLADKFNTLQMGIVSSERVFKLLDADESIASNGNVVLNPIKGSVEFKDVRFAYNEPEWVLKGVSMKVEPGKSLALVGATGAGKSSIIGLLGRFYEYQEGDVLIDGVSVRDLAPDELHNYVGIILQDVFLFSGTVMDNITLFNPSITREKVEELAELTGIDTFIKGLPGGYEFDVRERGGALSSGQRQLVAFLRAMAYNPAILVLDEATASVDTETEGILQRATDHLMRGRTVIAVAHRLSTIMNADQILVMHQGEVVERGSHAELLAQGGRYAMLYHSQFEEGDAVDGVKVVETAVTAV